MSGEIRKCNKLKFTLTPHIPSNQGRFGYTGQLYLHEVGLNYYKARIYHPKLGRFLQTDPVGYEDQMNLYAYVGNDPINLVDPTGKYSEEANMWANMFGFSSADQATTKVNNSLENGRQAVVNSTSPENLSGVSDTLAGATVLALVSGQPEVAFVTGIGSFVAGVGAAVQSDDPVAGVVTETALQVTGAKLVGTGAKIVSGALDATSAVKNGIDAASDATQTVIKNEIKERYKNE